MIFLTEIPAQPPNDGGEIAGYGAYPGPDIEADSWEEAERKAEVLSITGVYTVRVVGRKIHSADSPFVSGPLNEMGVN